MSNELGQIAIDVFRDRLAVDYANQIRACIGELNDEQFGGDQIPPVIRLAIWFLHLCGNLSHFIIKGVGGRPYERNRNSEFQNRVRFQRMNCLGDSTV